MNQLGSEGGKHIQKLKQKTIEHNSIKITKKGELTRPSNKVLQNRLFLDPDILLLARREVKLAPRIPLLQPLAQPILERLKDVRPVRDQRLPAVVRALPAIHHVEVHLLADVHGVAHERDLLEPPADAAPEPPGRRVGGVVVEAADGVLEPERALPARAAERRRRLLRHQHVLLPLPAAPRRRELVAVPQLRRRALRVGVRADRESLVPLVAHGWLVGWLVWAPEGCGSGFLFAFVFLSER